jgi:hypothetical protein
VATNPFAYGTFRHAAYADLLGRSLTPVEVAALDHRDAVRARKEASHQMWLDQLSAKERRRMGLPSRQPLC